MKRFSSFIVLVLFSISGISQFSNVVIDSLKSGQHSGIDLSLLLTRFGEEEPESAFEIKPHADDNDLSFNSVNLTQKADDIGVCCFYEDGKYIAHNCIDYGFPDVIDRSRDTIRIEFDAVWDELFSKGEAGKVILYLMYEYPEGGPPADVYNDLSEDYYGKPAYQLWILNGSNKAFMTYGDGNQLGGGFISLPADNPAYWLPGFTEKKTDIEIDQSEPYPLSPFARVMEGETVSTTTWKHYTWMIAPERMTLYWRNTSDGPEMDEEIFFMEIPEDDDDIDRVNEAHGSLAVNMPPWYEWFEEANAVRFFINNAGHYANIRVSKTGDPLHTYVEFRREKQVIPASTLTTDLELRITNINEEMPTQCQVSLVKGDAALVDNFSSEVVEFPADDDEDQVISLNVTAGDIETNDTLVFRITDISGGYLSDVYGDSEFTLVLKPGTSGFAPNQNADFLLSPNPASNWFSVESFHNLQHGKVELQIWSITGARCLQKMDASLSERVMIDHLSPGLYFLQIRSGDDIAFMKFIKY